MPNVKLCRNGEALYHNEAVQIYGHKVVDSCIPAMEFGSGFGGGRMVRVYRKVDLARADFNIN